MSNLESKKVKINPSELVEKEQSEQKIAAQKAIALDAAAMQLLMMLSEPVRDMIIETASTTLSIPLWQLIAGLIEQAYEIGTYTTPILDHGWSNNLPSKPAVFKDAFCENCRQAFKPRWPRQRWCSNECGIAFNRSVTASRDSQHVRGGIYPLGQEPRHAPSSALRPADPDEAPVVAEGNQAGVEGAAGLG